MCQPGLNLRLIFIALLTLAFACLRTIQLYPKSTEVHKNLFGLSTNFHKPFSLTGTFRSIQNLLKVFGRCKGVNLEGFGLIPFYIHFSASLSVSSLSPELTLPTSSSKLLGYMQVLFVSMQVFIAPSFSHPPTHKRPCAF